MRIAITGATGFVGGRLAERTVLRAEDEVVGVVRRFSGPGLARLARLPVHMAKADLTDREELRKAFHGCDVVVNCAYGTSGAAEERHRTTVEGTNAVLEAAEQCGVQRVIHISSTVVHGLPLTGVIDESSPVAAPVTPYDKMKVEAEAVTWEYHARRGYPVVVLRPPLIYGPNGRRWTERIVCEILAGATLVDGGLGQANFLHIDNLVDAILAAAQDGRGDGQAFLLVDDEPATWSEIYEGYASILPGAPPLKLMSSGEVMRERRRTEPGWLWASTVLPMKIAPELFRESVASPHIRRELRRIPWIRWLAATTSRSRSRSVGADEIVPRGTTAPLEYALPDPGLVQLMSCRGRYSADAARRDLGWTPRVTFAQALDSLAEWLAYHRLAS